MTNTAVVILSSPRKGSNSNALALAIAEGFEQAGGKVEKIDLSGLDIKPCLACDACQRNGGKCAQIDGMQMVYPKIVAAKTLILASPIYWFNVSGQLKVFLDRCYAVATAKDGPLGEKTLAGAFAFGDLDSFKSGAVNAVRCLQDICSFSGAKWGGYVYGSALDRDVLTDNKDLLVEAVELGRNLADC